MTAEEERYEKRAISLPAKVLAAVDQRAAKERRTRSNMICIMLEESLAAEVTPRNPNHRQPRKRSR